MFVIVRNMSKLQIFCDFHHSALAYSLYLLLEKRLGHEIFFPIGEEWADEGYWLIHKPYGYARDTVKQYLSLDQRYSPVDGTLPLNRINHIKPTHYEILDLAHNYTLKSITLEQFKQMDIDVIIASIPDHATSFKTLRDKLKPNAKLVFQAGNMFNELPQLVTEGTICNLLASCSERILPKRINAVYYHQEIELREFTLPPISPKITSLVHLLPEPEIYERFKKELAPTEMKAYGAGCPDGYRNGLSEVLQTISNSSIIYHNKKGADGFGHIIHSALMMGRPVIVNYDEYSNSLAGQLLVKDQNCIDVFDPQAVSKIKNWINNREELVKACRLSYNLFREKINYAKEALSVKEFLTHLI